MTRALVLGIDSSTTAVKAIAWDAEGRAVAEGRSAIPLENPAPGAWQQDAEDWWSAFASAVHATVESLGGEAAHIEALAIAHQRETFVVTDHAGVPVHPALVWMDARSGPEVEQAISALGASELHAITGKPPCTTPSLYKLMFLFGRAAPALARMRPLVLDVHAFLVHRLTGELATSLASADPTGMVDLRTRDWSDPVLALAGIDRAQLPALVEPGTRIGCVSEAAARATGLTAGLPVIAGAGDGQAAGLGTGVFEPGAAYLNLGTAVVSGVPSSALRLDLAFRTLLGAVPGSFFLETDLKGGTFTLGWLVERLLGRAGPVSATLDALEAEAERLPPGADGLVLIPYWNGVMNPYWDDDASGIVLGWRGDHGPAHLYRAVLEGIAMEQRLATDAVERATGEPQRELLVTGGGARSALWCRILADVMERPIVRTVSSEATALGAGMLAAAAAGLHPDVATAARVMAKRGQIFEPGEHRALYERLLRGVYAGLYPALREPSARLAELRAATRAAARKP